MLQLPENRKAEYTNVVAFYWALLELSYALLYDESWIVIGSI